VIVLLERLREYADVQLAGTLPPPGYQSIPVQYIVELDRHGVAHGAVSTASKEDKRGQPRLAPHAKRAMGIVPKLLADTGEYVFGIPRNDPKKPANPERVAAQHRQFRELVEQCAADTDEPSVRAVATLLASHKPGDKPDWLPADYDATATVTFRVEGRLPIDLPSVRRWWSASRVPEGGDVAAAMTCIVCGKVGPVLERHPLKIKGIPGGQILKDLISANAAAFESYGLTASETAPTCAQCAEAYGNALNSLLASRETSIWSGALAYAFWTEPREEAGFVPMSMISEPGKHPQEIARLITAIHRADPDPLLLDPTGYYTVALGASGARAVVKDWIDTTVGHALKSIGRYFELQRMVDWDGSTGEPLPLFRLAGATVRFKETPPDEVTKSLIRLAFDGTPLPHDLLYLAVRRNRAEQTVTRARAILLRMAFESGKPIDEVKESTMSGLDASRTDAAYVCGRMLAIIDRIQWSALGDVNASVIDKFFGSASSNPGLTFPILLRGAQFHLNKLARDKPGTRVNLQRELEETSELIDGFPARLNLQDQGVFALGFYHQRAHDRAEAKARNRRRDEATQEEVA
jgi:CRISPR-associated protein Csd1